MGYCMYFFDIDGTLLDSVESLAHSANQTLETFGLPPQPVKAYNMFAGDGPDMLISRALTASGDKDLKYYAKARVLYKANCKKNAFYHLKPYSGIVEMLNGLKENGVRMAAISNKPHEIARMVIHQFFGEEIFDIVLGLKDGVIPKPNPEETHKIADLFQIPYAQCVFVGDTGVDIQTGLNAGMKSVGVTWGFQTREMLEKAGAEQIVDTPDELLWLE